MDVSEDAIREEAHFLSKLANDARSKGQHGKAEAFDIADTRLRFLANEAEALTNAEERRQIVYYGGRGIGKTTKMIDWFLEGGYREAAPYWDRVLICAEEAMVSYLRDEIRKRFPILDTKHLVTVPRLDRIQGVGRDVKVGVDNVEWLIERWLGRKPDVMTYDTTYTVFEEIDRPT